MSVADLTLVVPCYNEGDNVVALFEEATACFEQAGVKVEYVFVDDGSHDGTAAAIADLVEAARTATGPTAPIVQAIGFSRNFGKEAALFAGLQAARGDCVGFIDADGQQSPADALRMYTILRETPSADIVAATQVDRREGWVLKLFKRAFYRTFNAAADDIDLPDDVSDFRVFTRTVADALLLLPEYDRFSKGLFAWIGFETVRIEYTPRRRANGNSSWSFGRLFTYAVNGIFSFTTWPLKVAIWLGVVATVAALIYLIVVVVEYLVTGVSVPGYPTIVCLILIFGGLQLTVLGIIGEYLARAYIEGKQRPIYLAKMRLDSQRSTTSSDNGK